MIACSKSFGVAFKNDTNSESRDDSAYFGTSVKTTFIQSGTNKRINTEKINFDQQHSISKFCGLFFTIFKVRIIWAISGTTLQNDFLV